MQQYVVRPHDTLYLISKEFDVPLVQLIRANPQITNPNLIYEGQTINIPNLLTVPDQIGSLETNAVNIIDDIYRSDWASANSRVNEIRTTMNTLVPILQEAEVPNDVIFELNATIRTLEQNVTQRRAYPAISQANRITQILADVLDYFNVIVPPDLLRLAYFARQLIVNVEQNDWAEALQNYRRAMAVWQRIRPLLGNYAQDVAVVDQVFVDLLGSINSRDYRTAIDGASRILELNERLTANFEQMYT
ncbi:MAG TPA: LysM peptidoglycan-binding domain-containing protein [Anaerovoracaceae bacterium]|nr:LysM peptidoglycan-binding domain-containing protein [Anaerovoracaceae bacterium]